MRAACIWLVSFVVAALLVATGQSILLQLHFAGFATTYERIALAVVPATVFIGYALLASADPLELPRIESRIDKLLGMGAYRRLLKELRPSLLIGTLCLGGGFEQLLLAAGANSAFGLLLADMDISVGVGILLMRAILARRGLLMEAEKLLIARDMPASVPSLK